MSSPEILRAHAEVEYAEELAALARHDTRPRPPSWRLSPWAVRTYLLGVVFEIWSTFCAVIVVWLWLSMTGNFALGTGVSFVRSVVRGR